MSETTPSFDSEEFARFCELHELAKARETHWVPPETLQEYQRLCVKYGRHIVDMVPVGPPDPTKTPNADPIWNKDCRPIDGQQPRVCPRSRPNLPPEALPAVERKFRDLRLVGPDQTILWVGRQDRMETRCWYGQGCDCFAAPANTNPPPAATGRTIRSKRVAEQAYRVAFIAILSKHHQYGEDRRLNTDPIGNNDLARRAGADKSTASDFFKKEFGDYRSYKRACRDPSQLLLHLQHLNNELPLHKLFGRVPPNERDRDDDA